MLRHAFLKSITLQMLTMLAVALPAEGRAQEVAAQYFETIPLYNPAAAGASGLLDIRAGAHLDRSPGNLYLLSADAPLPVGPGKLGMGISAAYDEADPLRTTSASLRGSFAISLGSARLYAGLTAGYIGRRYDYPTEASDESEGSDESDFSDGADFSDFSGLTAPAAASVKLKASALDLGAGLFFVNKRLWGGISLIHANAPELNFGRLPGRGPAGPDNSDNSDNSDLSDASDLSEGSEGSDPTEGSDPSERSEPIKLRVPRTLYAMVGTTISLSRNVELLPSAMLGSAAGSTWVDLTSRVRYRGIFTLGASWRNARSATLLASINYKGLFAVYAYGIALSTARRAQSHGYHEIMAGYSLRLSDGRKSTTRHKSIRLM